MALIKITDDNYKKTTCSLLSYSILLGEEGLLLEISIPNACIKYLLHSDRNERNMNNIEAFISTLFDDALLNNKMVHLEEYLVRHYIIIGDDKERMRQFTAQKL